LQAFISIKSDSRDSLLCRVTRLWAGGARYFLLVEGSRLAV